jgi:hypothetical protein
VADADFIHLHNLLPHSRDRFPSYRTFIDEADRSVTIAQRKITDWGTEIIDPELPIERKPLSLRIRCAIFGVLVTQRAVSLAEGLAREIEAAALFPAGAVARAQVELVRADQPRSQTIPAAAAKLPDANRSTSRPSAISSVSAASAQALSRGTSTFVNFLKPPRSSSASTLATITRCRAT